MPKLTSLLLAVLLICLTLNFCTKNKWITVGLSGLYSDTMTLKYGSTLKDTVIIKTITRINDTTYVMNRFLGNGWACDSAFIFLRPNNTVRISFWIDSLHASFPCMAFLNAAIQYRANSGYYDPQMKYFYLEFGNCFYNVVRPHDSIPYYLGAERLKKIL